MTFRPSDDVLDEIANDQQVSSSLDQYYNDMTKWDWEHFLQQSDDDSNQWNNSDSVPDNNVDSIDLDVPTEEVKAPDLSQLLQNSWDWNNTTESTDFSIDLSDIQNRNAEGGVQETSNSTTDSWGEIQQSNELSDVDGQIPGKLPDTERAKLVSKINWSIHGNLDFLVNEEWYNTVEKYRMIHRIVFRWWSFIFVAVLWILAWVMFQVNAKETENYEIVKDSTINKWWWVKETTASILSNLNDTWVETILSFGSASVSWKTFQSKSNLIKYKWIVLPQLVYIDTNKEFFSLEKFKVWETTREDLEDALNELILKNTIYQKTSNLSSSVRWKWQTFHQWWLIDGFSLSCLNANRAVDVVCDRFVDIFYEYWKYFDLSRYGSELYTLTRDLKSQNKDIKPICKMVQEYTWRSWIINSDFLDNIMQLCGEEDQEYYNKMVDFIEIDNSLSNPELSDRVFDNSDLNAYKLLSAMQKMHNFLEMNQINENFTDSYLKFVQALINKDRWTNKYLDAFYKDLLYIFNEDYLLKWLTNTQQGGWISSQKLTTLRSQIDQINNGDVYLRSKGLLSMLTTPNIIKKSQDFTWIVIDEKTIDELFLQYRSMNDRLVVRRVEHIWNDKLRVQTEIKSEAIKGKTNWESLKATVVLSRKNNLLYVDEIKIANQPAFSQVLNIYAKESVTFYAMLMYIDEQVGFHYVEEPELENKQTLCDELKENEDISIYTCSDSEIVLYKWEVEYKFVIIGWILELYTISDASLESEIKDQLSMVMMTKDNTPTIIVSIVNYEPEVTPDNTIEKKLEIIDEFRIHFKIIPNVYDIDWEDGIFTVEFSLWDFNLKARYNTDTHLMTRISYVACDKTLEIRWLAIEVSAGNEAQLTEILNNPRVFLTNANQAAFKKYQKMCDEVKN